MSDLNERHVKYLEARAVDIAVARAAGLHSVSAAEGARLLGRRTALLCGGLAIPYQGVVPSYVRVRLDAGETRYLAPKNRDVPVYVPSQVDAASSGRVVVVESPIKALALVSVDIMAVGLGGTGTTLTTSGSTRRLNDSWSRLNLENRQLVVLFDGNRATNTAVARDEARLTIALERAGATVLIARLPDGVGDVGPDDFLASEGREALEKVLESAIPAEPSAYMDTTSAVIDAAALLDDMPFLISVIERGNATLARAKAHAKDLGIGASEWNSATSGARAALKGGGASGVAASTSLGLGFDVVEGKLGRWTVNQQGGRVFSALANFSVEIVGEIIRDDGADLSREFDLEGKLADGTQLPTIRVQPSDLTSTSWVLEKWGARASVRPGRDTSSNLLCAMQQVSTPSTRTAVVHTGWRSDDDGWYFAHAGGSVGRPDVQVELDGNLGRYQLPSQIEDPTEALRTSLSLRRVGPARITTPLLAAMYRAPLCSSRPFDSTLWCHGQSGTRKSTVTALFVCRFGAFDYRTHATSWASTAASIENTLFLGQDVPLVIDDFVPSGASTWDDMHRKAQTVLRSVGNQAGRGRMRADMTAQTDRPPRGLVLSTGEDLPTGGSIVARTLPVEFLVGDVNMGALDDLQGRADRLPHAMAAYLQWLAPQMGGLRQRLDERFKWWRADFQRQAAHGRTPETLANLMLGIELLAEFSQSMGVMGARKARTFVGEAAEVLRSLGEEQGLHTLAADPVRLFLDTLGACLANGTAELCDDHKEPLERFGSARPIGWRRGPQDAGYVYLEPQAVYETVRRALKGQGASMPLQKASLWARMRDRGLLRHARDRCDLQRSLGGKRPWVIAMQENAVPGLEGADDSAAHVDADADAAAVQEVDADDLTELEAVEDVGPPEERGPA